jgi:hypothetical protein
MKQKLTLVTSILILLFSSLESKPKRELRILIDADAEAKFELELWHCDTQRRF